MLLFERNETKNKLNILRHGIDFEQAKLVFQDTYALDVLDDRFDYGEERWLIIGRAAAGVLAVVYVQRGDVYRLISARHATKQEADAYIAQENQ